MEGSATTVNEDLNTFLDLLYETESGYVYSPSKDATDSSWHQKFFKWPEQRSELVAHINSATHKAEVYIAPAMFTAPDANKENFQSTRYLWTEFDGNKPQAGFDPCPNPSLIVQSSDDSHVHVYWRLSERSSNAQEVEALNRGITYSLNADSSSWDCNQVLRPPNTRNHKRGEVTKVIQSNPNVYGHLDFSNVPAIADVEVNVGEAIPDVADIILKYPFSADAANLFKSPALPMGERSSGLMRMGYFCAEMGMSDVEIFSVLRNADDRWGKFRDRNDRIRRLSDLISKVRIKVPASEAFGDPNVIPVYGFDSFLRSEIEIEWVIEGLLEQNGYMLLSGPSGVGKTQFSLQVAIHLALGRDFLGMKIDKPQKLIMFSLEMGHAPLKLFLSKMAHSFSEADLAVLEENFYIVPLGEAWYLDGTEGQQRMVEVLETIRPNGIIIDSVGSTSSGQVSDEATVKKLMDFNDKVRNRFNVFTWWIHHNRKAQSDNKKPNKQADIYGNQYLVNRATSIYVLWPSTRGVLEVIPIKKRLDELGQAYKIQRLSDLSFAIVKGVSFAQFDEDSLLAIAAPVGSGPAIMSGIDSGLSDI